ncbi:unnamed protein product, partial [Mesorhabditis spiculigera]
MKKQPSLTPPAQPDPDCQKCDALIASRNPAALCAHFLEAHPEQIYTKTIECMWCTFTAKSVPEVARHLAQCHSLAPSAITPITSLYQNFLNGTPQKRCFSESDPQAAGDVGTPANTRLNHLVETPPHSPEGPACSLVDEKGSSQSEESFPKPEQSSIDSRIAEQEKEIARLKEELEITEDRLLCVLRKNDALEDEQEEFHAQIGELTIENRRLKAQLKGRSRQSSKTDRTTIIELD